MYVQLPKSQKKHNYKLIHSILKKLIQIDHEDFQLEELIVGEIKQNILTPLYQQNISVQDYLSFFIEFMADQFKVEKDLGKFLFI